MAKLLYQGHGSLRITTGEGAGSKVIYVDPFAGEGYDLPADLILVSHQHSDHNCLDLISSKNPGCVVISEKEALKDGEYQSIDLGYALVEGFVAKNINHNPAECVGFVLTLSGDEGVSIYISCDTSKMPQMAELASRKLDYALFCCDGVYNMGIREASECAQLVGARVSIPYHMKPGELFDRSLAELFREDGRLIIEPGEEIELV